MKNTIRLGVVGLGNVAVNNYLPFLSRQENVELYCCSRDSEKAKACAERFGIHACSSLEEDAAHLRALRDRFIARVQREIPFVKLNGHPQQRLPGNANFSFRYIEGESLLFSLDLKGIAVSSGSACSSGSLEPSHVLLAMGLPEGLAHGSIRFSFGKDNTPEQVDYAVDALKEIVVKLRALSPLFPKELKNEVFPKEE